MPIAKRHDGHGPSKRTARDDSALGRFWAVALGWTISSEGPGVTNLEPGVHEVAAIPARLVRARTSRED
jgi:hypothetical protein